MASNVSRRTATLARRYSVDQAGQGALASVSLARSLASARMILWAEREAHTALKKLATKEFSHRQYSDPAQNRNGAIAAVAAAANAVRAAESEVRELERRCAEVGLTEKEIGEFAR